VTLERFLVLGSNSFSGSHFVRHLLDLGHEVLGASRSEEPSEVFLAHRWGDVAGFHFEQIDLNHDLDRLMGLIEALEPSHVVNFAAQGMVAQSWEHPDHWYQTNVVAQVRLHDRLRSVSSLKKYVHISTPEVYGSTDGEVQESFDFAPTTPYAVSRAACDLHLRSFYQAYGFPVVFTRAANVYGPGQQVYRIIPRAMLSCLLGRRLPLHGGGESKRNFIHIQDVCAATYEVALKGVAGESYHVAGKSTVTIRELVEAVCVLAGCDPDEVVDLVPDRIGKDQCYLLDSTRVRNSFGWFEAISLSEGLSTTMRWVGDNIEVLSRLPVDYIHKP
jgi:dTDP-glucose 4,6-dehydratase